MTFGIVALQMKILCPNTVTENLNFFSSTFNFKSENITNFFKNKMMQYNLQSESPVSDISGYCIKFYKMYFSDILVQGAEYLGMSIFLIPRRLVWEIQRCVEIVLSI